MASIFFFTSFSLTFSSTVDSTVSLLPFADRATVQAAGDVGDGHAVL